MSHKLLLFRRVAAFVYDVIALIGVLMVGTALVLPLTGGDAVDSGNFFFQLYLWFLIYCYYLWCWTHGGQTIGMKLWKIQLSMDKQVADLKLLSLRFLGGSICVLLLGLPLLLAKFMRQPIFYEHWTGLGLVHLCNS